MRGLPVLDVLTFILAAMAVIVVLQYLADRTGLPAAALLTVAGLVYGVLPGPNVTLDPHVILTFVIPPLIYSAALNSSLLAIRENMRTVISLSIGLVLATAVVTGIGMDLFVPGVGLAAGIALGAALSPTDPVAALAVGGRAGLPPKLITIIEGEGLLNDATALTTLTVAVTAATSGGFAFGDAVLRFLLAAAGGLLCGVAVAIIVRLARSAVRDPLLVNGISLATPFAAYLLGEELHVSGVLAVAVAGLMIGHDTPVHLGRQPAAGHRSLAPGRLPAPGLRLPAGRPADRAGHPRPEGVSHQHDRGRGGGQPRRRAAAEAAVAGAHPIAAPQGARAHGPGRPRRPVPVRPGNRRAELGRHPGRDQPGGDLHAAPDHRRRAPVPRP
jgi:hypothetical protein